MTLTLEIPDAVVRELHLNAEEAQRRTLVSLVIEGYRRGELSRGRVSELLDLSFWETEALLKQQGCALKMTFEEFQHDYEQARAYLGQP